MASWTNFQPCIFLEFQSETFHLPIYVRYTIIFSRTKIKIQIISENFVSTVFKKAKMLCEHADRKTVAVTDIQTALHYIGLHDLTN